MGFIPGNDRHQVSMISLDQMVDKEAFVRIIDASHREGPDRFIDTLDLDSFGFDNAKLNKKGRPPFHPSVLLKLYLYGYQHRIRSCRKYNSKVFRHVFRAFVST